MLLIDTKGNDGIVDVYGAEVCNYWTNTRVKYVCSFRCGYQFLDDRLVGQYFETLLLHAVHEYMVTPWQ